MSEWRLSAIAIIKEENYRYRDLWISISDIGRFYNHHKFTFNDYYPCYYIKEHIGNNSQTWICPYPNYKECIQKTQYYPSGLPWNVGYMPSMQPYKYNGKEYVEQCG